MTANDFTIAYEKIRSRYETDRRRPALLKNIVLYDKWVLVFASEGQAGMAFTFTGDHAVYGMQDYGVLLNFQKYVGKPLFELAEAIMHEDSIPLRSLCLAVFNALSQPFLAAQILKRSYDDLTDVSDVFHKDDVISIVGYGGMLDRTMGKCRELHVLDMRPISRLQVTFIGEEITYGPRGIRFHSAEDAGFLLPRSDVILLTGCTLVNGTFQELAELSKGARVFGIYGPSAQIIPEYLAELGIHYISTCRIRQADLLYERLMECLPGQEVLKDHLEPFVIGTRNLPVSAIRKTGQ